MSNVKIFSDKNISEQEIVNIQDDYGETVGLSLTVSLKDEDDNIHGYVEIILPLEELQIAMQHFDEESEK